MEWIPFFYLLLICVSFFLIHPVLDRRRRDLHTRYTGLVLLLFFFQDLFSLFLSVAKHTKKKDYEKEEKNKTTICKVHSESKQKGHLDFYMAK